MQENLEDSFLNERSQNENSLQIATTNDDLEPSLPYYIFYDIREEYEASLLKGRYTSARDLRAVSQNQVIGEPSQEIRTRSSLRLKLNRTLISEI